MTTSNFFTTQDSTANLSTHMVKAFGFVHQGAAGSSSLQFGTSSDTQHSSADSGTSANAGDGVFGGNSGSAAVAGSGGAGAGGNNVYATQDHTASTDTVLTKMIDFSHQGAAGSSNLAFGTATATHQTNASSTTLANLDDGVFGGSGGHTGGSSIGGSSTGGSGGAGSNVFSTNDSVVHFDSDMVKALSFSHQGAAGSSGLSFGTESITHQAASNSTTSSMFDDGAFGSNSDLFGSLLQSGGSHSLIG